MLKNRIYFCSKSFAESISDYLQNFPVVFLYFKLLDFSKDLTDKNCYMSGERGRKRSSDKKMPSKLGISACLVRNNDDLVEDEVEEEVIPDPMVEKGSKLKPNKNGASEKPKCVWYDPDDDQLDEEGVKNRRTKLEARRGELYQSRLIQNFEMVYGPTPKWARLDTNTKKSVGTKADEDEKMDFVDSMQLLSLGKLEVVRVENLNSKRNEGAIIQSVDFHPESPVGLAAGNSCVSLYQVDGSTNPLIQSIAFDDFPIRKAQFCCKGEEIYVSSGLKDHFYCYDMHSGNTRQVKPTHATRHETIRNLVPSPDNKYLISVGRDTIYMLSKSSKELIHMWSVNSEIKGVSFSPDGRQIFVQECTGGIYRWNVNSRSCIEKFTGKSDFDGTCLATSSKYIACGSSSGYVSIFENRTEKKPRNEIVPCLYKEPLGELKNLVTSISSLKINCSEEILAMASVEKDNALRLVHLPTRKTFAHFPATNANYGRCNSVAFSPNSGYIATGSNRGCAYLFRLKHYSDY